MSRSKSVLNMMMMSYLALGVIGIVYVLWGWSMASRATTSPACSATPTPGRLKGVPWSSYIGGVMFQMTFAAITVALISGSDRGTASLSAWIVFIPIWATLCYFPISHQVWVDGGLCSGTSPRQDYAGGTVVHINAGVAGLVLALVIGKRVGFGKEPMRPHNLTLTMIGAGLLWFGWYGFNVGSMVVAGDGAEGHRPVHVGDRRDLQHHDRPPARRCSAGC